MPLLSLMRFLSRSLPIRGWNEHRTEGQEADRGRAGHGVKAVPGGQRREETDRCAERRRRCREHQGGDEEAPFSHLAGEVQHGVALPRERSRWGTATTTHRAVAAARTERAPNRRAKPPAQIRPAPSSGPMM